MEALLALTQPTQVNKNTSLCEICSGPHDTQYCMENPEQAFIEYAYSRTNEAGGDANPIRTLGDYSKPSHEGYRNTIELPVGNNVVPLRSDTIWEKSACVYFNFPFTIKLATGLNVFQQDPSPHGRILLLLPLLNSFHQEGL
uniref:MAK10-like protein n=1 Tax=Tanacetum cinerariifolium TaxID=118510 RepID=A0A6L2NVP3_TANCI|nr:MAK10-like protein [Tanacetum cinerariifolium]